MAALPGSQTQESSVFGKNVLKKKAQVPDLQGGELLESEEIEEKTESEAEEKQPPAPFVFPEADEEWISLLKKHLWIITSSDKPKMVRESKIILNQVPREAVERIVEPYLSELLNSEIFSERNKAGAGIRYMQISSLVNDVLGKLPPVHEEQSDPSTPFYLIALGAGDRSVSKALLSYALHSKIPKNRVLALESLIPIRDPDVVAPCLERLQNANQHQLDYPILIQVLAQSIGKQHYPLLIQFFESKDPQHRKEALSLMRQVDLPYFLEYYKKGLDDSNHALRLSAYCYFTELSEPSCAEYLLNRAKNKDLPRKERIFSLEAASRAGKKLNPRDFDSFVQEKDPSIRLVALMTQAYLKDKQSIAGLIEMLAIPDEDIIVPQGSDLEEERTWIRDQVEPILKLFTGKEFSEQWQWKQWWAQQKNFKFPAIQYMEKLPALYIHR